MPTMPWNRMSTTPWRLPAALLALALAGCATAPPSAPAPVHVELIAFNDFHGNLQPPGRYGETAQSAKHPVGGADALAAWVAHLEAGHANHVVVGGGDFVGASPLVSALFFDEPAVEVLNHVGVDFTSVGNHEFDKGAAELLRLQHGGCRIAGGQPDANSCKGLGSKAPGAFDGARFQWLSANVVDTASGRTLLPAYGIKTFDGIPVAFIGMTLRGTAGIVSPAGVAGLDFRDEADTVNALVPQLRAQGVEAIVVLVHQGGVQPGGLNDINGCDGALRNADGSESDIGKIVHRLDDAVDLVVSAHTHAAYNCSANAVGAARATGLPNAAGRLVPVTSAASYGRVLTDIDLALDPRTHDVVQVAAVNRLVLRDDPAVPVDAAVRDIVQGYATLAAPLADRVVGQLAQALPNEAREGGQAPAGSLVADAQLRATQAPAAGAAQMALMNPGGVRAAGFVPPAGASAPFALTFGAAFTVQPFGNGLVTMSLTSTQLKALLEQQFDRCTEQLRECALQLSAGLRVKWSASAPAGAHIVDVDWTPVDLAALPPQVTGPTQSIVNAGVVLEPARQWRVTVNSFLASGGDGYSTLLAGTDRVAGGLDLDALAAYLGPYRAPHAPYDARLPALGEPRQVRLP
jgi:5'-nucleotidase